MSRLLGPDSSSTTNVSLRSTACAGAAPSGRVKVAATNNEGRRAFTGALLGGALTAGPGNARVSGTSPMERESVTSTGLEPFEGSGSVADGRRFEGPQADGDEDDVQGGQELRPELRAVQVGRQRIQKLAGAAGAGDDDGDDDRVQQRRQQHVAAARAQQRRREHAAGGGEADRAQRQQQATRA